MIQNVPTQNMRKMNICLEIPVKSVDSFQMYADDATYLVSNKLREENRRRTERTLGNIEMFLKENELNLNVAKMTVLECMIPQKQGKTAGSPLELEVEIAPERTKLISDTGSCRILGINFQSNMSWFSHLESGEKALLHKIRKQLGAIRHLGVKVPMSFRRTLANSLIISRLAYLVAIWGSSTGNQTRRAQVLMNTVAHWITGMKKSSRVRTLMEAVGWLTITEMNLLHSCVLMWKLIHLKKPGHLASRITVGNEGKIETAEPDYFLP